MLSEIEAVRQKLMNNATNKYDAVISLGGSCASCLQIRKRELQTYAYPFDYVFCVDAKFQFNILAELFRTDFENWLDKRNIVPLKESEKGISDLFQYKDKYTEFRYIHDFRKPITDEGVYEEFYDKYKRRLDRLYDKIKRSHRILFVSDAVSRLQIGDVKPLLKVLNKKWGDKVFDIAVLNFNSERNEIIRQQHLKLVNITRVKNNYDFFGMNYEWGEILDAVKVESSQEDKAATILHRIYEFFSKSGSVNDFADNDNVFFITGCSSGIGRKLCELLLSLGYKVVATARDLSGIGDLKEKYPSNALCLELDVTDEKRIKAAVKQAIGFFGKIDVLVNNAGKGYFSVVERIDNKVAHDIMAVNFFGALNMMQAVLPHMRAKNAGLIINISSVAALDGLPTAGIYSASKAALERVSESLKEELRDSKVKVVLVELGETQSNFYKNSVVNSDVPDGYSAAKDVLSSFVNNVYFHPQIPERVAAWLVNRIKSHKELPFRLLSGNGASAFVDKKISELRLAIQLSDGR